MKNVAKVLLTGAASLLIVGAYASRAIAAPPTPTNPSPGSTSSPGPTTSSTSVTLSWSASTGATTYGVGVRDMSTNVLVVDTNTSSTSYTANLSAGKPYRWNVNACNSTGCSSFTAVRYFQTPAPIPPTPGNPSPGSTSSPGPTTSSTSVTLSWSASTGATTYGVGVRDMSTNVLVVDTNTSGTSYTANLSAGKPYRWNVNACNSSGCSSFTTVRYFQTPAAAPGVPVLTLTAECSGTTSQIRLNWTSTSGATSYDVYRNGAVYTTGLTGTQFINTAVTPGTAYSYAVLARNSSGSTGSATKSATAPNCAAGPGVPVLTLTSECSGTTSQIRLNWTAASGATSYDVYRNFAVYATGLTGTQFINTAVTPGTTYNYSVLARNSSGSTGSATKSATAPNCAAGPGVPLLTLTAECSGTTSQIRLNWTSTTGATSYDVYRNFAVYTTGLTGTQFINTAVTPGTTYNYSVLARNSSGSTGSATQSATAPNTCGATDAATFVSETILDGTQIGASQAFTKSWTIRNSGTSTWNSNYRLRWVSGASLSSHSDVIIAGTVAPGSMYTFIVPMTAPASGGTYREDWKLINGSGTTIPVNGSSTIWVRIQVADSSGTDKADFVAETHLDGTTVPAGQGFTKNWTVRNSGTTTWSSTYRLRWVSGANLSNHADVAISGSVPPGSSYTLSVPMTAPNTTGTYREDWKLINGGGATVPISGSSTIWVSVRVNVGGQSSITGSVTSSSGVSIAGANVQIGSNNIQSNSQGAYSISNIAAGDYTATVSKTGYATFSGLVSIPANTQINRNFTLQPNTVATSITISSVTSKYPGKSFFLEGLTQNVTFTVNVDWGGHPPGSVSFITPRHTYDIITNSGVASKTLDIGSEFSPCQKLKVRARSTDGTVSTDKEASFAVMSRPPLYSALRLIDSGDDFNYSDLSLSFGIDKLTKSVAGASIPSNIPFFGNSGVEFDFTVAPTFSITRDGRASYTLGLGLDRTATTITKGRVAGFEFEVSGRLGIAGNYSDTACKWNWGGTVGFHTNVYRRVARWRIPQTLFIVYVEGGVGVRGDAQLIVNDIAPWELDGQAWVEPYARFAVGGGLDMVLAVEGRGELGGKFNLHPELDLTFQGSGSYRIVSRIGHYIPGLPTVEREHKVINCSWSLRNGGPGCEYRGFTPAGASAADQLTLYPREYLESSGYATFRAYAKEIKTQTLTASTEGSVIQSAVFPLSDASISSSGSHLYSAWLHDEPARSTINRSEVVFSAWNGSAWSEPKPIVDDGTGDYHPRVLTFGDGSALAVWEDSNSVLPDTATAEQLLGGVEISASFLDPTSTQWVNTRRLTTNGHLDRSPLIAGQASDDALLVWVSNEQNDISGSAAKPNKLWAAKWNGTSWSEPQAVATVPYGLVKYDLTYKDNKGDVTLSLDSDNNPSTDEDHELYALHYEGGAWSNLTRLTNDSVTDANPRMAMDSKGNQVLIWMKGDQIFSATNGDVAGKKLIAAPGRSTNVADFKLATTPEGRIALVWAGVGAQFDSDLQVLFYDPALDIWGNQGQLTSDQELEANIAATFYGNKLIAIYDRTTSPTQTSVQNSNPASQQTSIPALGTTDLYVLTHTVGGDLAIKPNTLEAAPGNPRLGEVTTLTATILNQGDIGARDVPVSFYQGNPASGGILIGTAIVASTLAPGDEQQVGIPWIPASTTSPLSIYVVVDPNQIFDDANRTNNVASKQVVRADLAIQSTRWERQTHNSVVVIARVVNLGSLPTLPTSVSFRRDSSTGILLSSPAIGGLDPDQSVDVAIQWDTTGLNSPQYTLYLLADPNNSVDEYDKTNNGATLVVSLNASVATIQLILDQSSSASDQLVALDSVLFTGGPFLVTNPANSLNTTPDRNTRVMIFISNLQLAPGEPSSSVVVNLIDVNNQSYDIAAEDVRPVPNLALTQIIFRLPNNLPVGTCTIKIKAQGQVSNAGTIRIRS